MLETPSPFGPSTALILIDLQNAMDAPIWRGLNNPDVFANLKRVLERWRALGWPVFMVAHDSRFPDSPFRPGQPGNDFRPGFTPREGEEVIRKTTNSAFLSTDLERRLRDAAHQTLVIGGVVTNNSVEATVRVAGDLGFDTYVLADGTAAVPKTDSTGREWEADDIHELALANMEGEYARVITVEELLRAINDSTAV